VWPATIRGVRETCTMPGPLAISGVISQWLIRSPQNVGARSPPFQQRKALLTAVKEAVETLKDGEALIVLPAGTECRLAEPIVDTDIDSDPSSESEGADHHEHHEADEHKRHSEFTAEYHFVCKHPEKLAHIDVMLLRGFPGIERIEVQLLTGTKQTALELTAKKNRIPF